MSDFSGLAVAAFGLGITLPFDYNKTQKQIRYNLRIPTGQKFIGLDAVVPKLIINTAIKYVILEDFLPDNTLSKVSFQNLLIAGLLTPFDNLLVKLQTQGVVKDLKLSNIYDAYKYTIASNNPSLFRGIEANLFRHAAFYLSLNISNVNLGARDNIFGIISGIYIASTVAITFSHPFDTIRTNMQKCGSDGSGFLDSAISIFKANGLPGFYGGFLPAVIRHSSTVLIFVFLKLIGESKDRYKVISVA